MILKSLLCSTLSSMAIITSLGIFPLNVNAQTNSQANCVQEPQSYISPELLATMAYRESFKKEGIPGYGVLETEFSAGNITAKDIVQAAIKACVLSNEYGIASHENYVDDVKSQLQSMIQADNSR
ncbi:unknown [Crocosphaera subtropica ATCC 51142]|uniref:Uncharacterized protein n=1 Tax=Crocosphaera subtropica (strain ATCC 51142 / BH68) TaxID=43989 RepID=B1WVL9_CROS5|nr:hypothetical protein [Crocosphaera subtropica]ACB50606.1 unknown [Crocosphaera subtropica ATCC 51142]